MKITLNGAERHIKVPPGETATIATLLVALGLRSEIVAIELNGALVPRATHGETELSEGDEVECVTLVGGG